MGGEIPSDGGFLADFGQETGAKLEIWSKLRHHVGPHVDPTCPVCMSPLLLVHLSIDSDALYLSDPCSSGLVSRVKPQKIRLLCKDLSRERQ